MGTRSWLWADGSIPHPTLRAEYTYRSSCLGTRGNVTGPHVIDLHGGSVPHSRVRTRSMCSPRSSNIETSSNTGRRIFGVRRSPSLGRPDSDTGTISGRSWRPDGCHGSSGFRSSVRVPYPSSHLGPVPGLSVHLSKVYSILDHTGRRRRSPTSPTEVGR